VIKTQKLITEDVIEDEISELRKIQGIAKMGTRTYFTKIKDNIVLCSDSANNNCNSIKILSTENTNILVMPYYNVDGIDVFTVPPILVINKHATKEEIELDIFSKNINAGIAGVILGYISIFKEIR